MATSSLNTGVRRSKKSEATISKTLLHRLTKLDRDGNLGQFLEHTPNSDTRVITRSASDEKQPSASPDDWEIRLETSEHDTPGIKVDSTSHSVDDGFGLFVDFLLHKVVILPLHNLRELDLERLDSPDRRKTVVPSQSVDVEFSFGDMSNIVIFEVQDSFGVLDDSTGITGNEELNGLGEAILGHESPRLGSAKLAVRSVGERTASTDFRSAGNREKTASALVDGFLSV